MALVAGKWDINGNGAEGTLVIQGVDGQGRLQGTVFGQKLVGWWDEEDKRITFLRVSDPANPASFQTFSGYHWDEEKGFGRIHYLAGSFETYAGGGGSAKRPTYGWYAQISVLL